MRSGRTASIHCSKTLSGVSSTAKICYAAWLLAAETLPSSQLSSSYSAKWIEIATLIRIFRVAHCRKGLLLPYADQGPCRTSYDSVFNAALISKIPRCSSMANSAFWPSRYCHKTVTAARKAGRNLVPKSASAARQIG